MYNNVPLDESGLTTTVGVVQAYLSTAESCDATRGRSKPRRDAYLYLNGFRPYISGSTLPHSQVATTHDQDGKLFSFMSLTG